MNRIQLFDTLSNLSSHDFERLIVSVNMPRMNRAGASAKIGEQVSALLEWADSEIGPGLDEVQDCLNKLQNGTLHTAFDFSGYLQTICGDPRYQPVRDLYTETEVLIPLEAETVEKKSPKAASQREAEPPQQTVDRFPVLEGLRKYALGEQRQHLLLAGRPGSGKSTTLKRLLLELAEATSDQPELVPVYVQLKGDRPITDLIIAEFRRAKVRVTSEQIDEWLFNDQLLLLLDGVNEVPSKRRDELDAFRADNLTTPMIFTTRELAMGGELGIQKRLEMRPLSELQMREFVNKYLTQRGFPHHADTLLRQLKDRLKEIAETPLLLKMLCDVFDPAIGQIPQNKGELFRLFDHDYERKKKNIEAVPVSENFWEFKAEVLQFLAFSMIQTDELKSVEAWYALPRSRAEREIETWLNSRGVTDAPTKAKLWLKDLLRCHLLQDAREVGEIEFHHQLFQEYYAAEELLLRLPDLLKNEESFKRDYLNYLKWTEAIALMLALVDEETHALRVVKLAMNDMDLMLGVKLTIGIDSSLQAKIINMITERNIPIWLKILLLGKTQSLKAVDKLKNIFENSEAEIRRKVIWSSQHLNSDFAIPMLKLGLEDSDPDVREVAVRAFGEFDIRLATAHVVLILRKEKSANVKTSAVICVLGKSDSEAAVVELFKLMEDAEHNVSTMAEHNLKKMRPELVKAVATKCIENRKMATLARRGAVRLLGEIGDGSSVFALFQAKLDLNQEIHLEAHDALTKLKEKTKEQSLEDSVIRKQETQKHQIENWLNHLKSEEPVRRGNAVLHLSSLLNKEEALDLVSTALSDRHHYVRGHAISSLSKLIGEEATFKSVQALGDPHYHVREQASQALLEFKELISSENLNISTEVTSNLIFILLSSQNEQEKKATVNTLVNLIHLAPSQILSEKLKDAFLHISSHSDNLMRRKAAKGLSAFDDRKAIDRLLEMLDDSDPLVAWGAAEELKRMPCEITSIYLSVLQAIIYHELNKNFILDVILSIQNRCGFYNYEIWQQSIQNEKLEMQKEDSREKAETHQHFHGPVYGVAGNVEGNQTITPPPAQ